MFVKFSRKINSEKVHTFRKKRVSHIMHVCTYHTYYYECLIWLFNYFLSISDWHLGQWICKLVPYFQGVSVNASINTLMAISVERCLSICNPMNPVSRGVCWRVVIIIWSISLTITLPWAIYFDLQPMENGSENQVIALQSFFCARAERNGQKSISYVRNTKIA